MPFGLPHDPAQWLALVLGLAAVGMAPHLMAGTTPEGPRARRDARSAGRVFLALAALAAAGLSTRASH